MVARTLIFHLAFYLNFIVQALVFSPVLLMPERFVWPIARFWTRSSLWLHRAICGIDEEIRGLDNLSQGPCLVACKHQSAWETLRIVGLLREPAFILKRELMWLPLFGWYLARTGMIPVERGSRSKALELIAVHARRALAEGRHVVIFPEGTRRQPLAEPVYKYGSTYLYKELGVPCVPVALNSGLFWPRRAFSHRRGTVLVEVCPPIEPGLEPEAFAARLVELMESRSAALVAESLARHPEAAATLAPDAKPSGGA